MNILVSGAGGILGRYMCRALLEAGHTVVGLSRNPAAAQRHLEGESRMQWREGDILDVAALEKALENIDLVVHAAGLVSFLPEDRNRLLKINGEGTANMVNACLAQGNIKKLIHISSVTCLSPSRPMPSEVDERQGFNPDKNTSDYAISKYAAEMEVCRGVEEGLPAVMLNPSIVLAPGLDGESSASLVHYASKPRLFYPSGWLNFVDARDLAAIVCNMVEKSPSEGQRMVVSGGCIPYRDFFGLIASKKGIRPPMVKTGSILSALAWRLAAAASFFTGKKPLLTRFTAASAGRQFIYRGIALEQYLGSFAFRKIEDSLDWIIGRSA